jgi:transcriptional regulator with XRE-family HTH domain
MDGLYVSKLFDLLKVLHVEQAEVVNELGVHKGQVSRWANGKRVLPDRYALQFVRFVATKLTEALAQAKANDQPAGSSILTGAGTRVADAFVREVMGLLAGWDLELYEQLGKLGEAVRNDLARLASYVMQDPAKLSTTQRRELYDTTKDLERHLRYSSFLRDEPDDRLLKRPIGRDDIDPLEYFRRLVTWAGIAERSQQAGADHDV